MLPSLSQWKDLIKKIKEPITTARIADSAVTADKADAESIMKNAGDNNDLFGLGGAATFVASLNNLTRTGFYTGQQLEGAPVNDKDVWWLVTHEQHSANWAVQVARSWYSGDVYQRGKTNGTWQGWTKLGTRTNVLNWSWPVGSIYISGTLDTAEKVATALGGGTWVAVHGGQTIMGYNSSDADFNSQGKNGGAKTVTLTTAQMPSHSHTIPYHNVYLASGGNLVSQVGGTYTTDTGNTGSGQAHNNLSPYCTRFIWRRSA